MSIRLILILTLFLDAESISLPVRGPMASLPKTLITFDIDGTICRSVSNPSSKSTAVPNALHMKSFSVAFKEIFGIDASIDEILHQGSTDQLILIKLLMHRGFQKEEVMSRLPDLKASMIRHAESNKQNAAEGLELLDGVKETLTALRARDDVITGLVTGNLEPIAWMKMEALGLTDCFSVPRFGGFGSDFCSGDVDASQKDRAEFVRIARSRALAQHGLRDEDIKEQFHIGDAPTDIEAAELAGASAIGVATGIFTADQLQAKCRAAGSSVLPSMASLPATLHALRLRGGDGGSGTAPSRCAAAGQEAARGDDVSMTWPALDLTEEVLTGLTRALGLPSPWAWHDVPSLEEEVLDLVPGRAAAAAAVLIFPADHLAHFVSPTLPQAPSPPGPAPAHRASAIDTPAGPGGAPPGAAEEEEGDVMLVRAVEGLECAAPALALINGVVNTPAAARAVRRRSALGEFAAAARHLDPAQRGLLLASHAAARRVYSRFAAADPDPERYHAVALVPCGGGGVWVLDGLGDAPVRVGPLPAAGPGFLAQAAAAAEALYVEPDPAGGADYSLFVLTSHPLSP